MRYIPRFAERFHTRHFADWRESCPYCLEYLAYHHCLMLAKAEGVRWLVNLHNLNKWIHAAQAWRPGRRGRPTRRRRRRCPGPAAWP